MMENNMVSLPEVVGTERDIIDGETVIKQLYADGSYGIECGNWGVEIHYPNNDVLTFAKRKDSEQAKRKDSEQAKRKDVEYYLYKEQLSDGTKRMYNEYGVKAYEKLPNGEERSWDIFFNTPYIQKEVIPGEVTRHYRLSGNYSLRGRLLPNTAFNYLAKEEFANGTEIEYYRSRTDKIKKSEKIDGIKTVFYEDGKTIESETFPNGDKIEYQDVKDKKVKKSETISGVKREYYADGVTVKREEYEKAQGEFEKGDYIEYHDSKDKKIKAIKNKGSYVTFYENGVKKSEELPNGVKKEWDSDGRITHEVRADKTVVDYKYDKDGKLVYHAVNGKEDTVKYLAMKKVAERQAEKSEKLREQKVMYTDNSGKLRPRQTVEVLKPVMKTIEMAKAMREVRKGLRRG